eukprot:UN03836
MIIKRRRKIRVFYLGGGGKLPVGFGGNGPPGRGGKPPGRGGKPELLLPGAPGAPNVGFGGKLPPDIPGRGGKLLLLLAAPPIIPGRGPVGCCCCEDDCSNIDARSKTLRRGISGAVDVDVVGAAGTGADGIG